ncbi:hypothetical protein D3C81_1902590 [compost metagenome]
MLFLNPFCTNPSAFIASRNVSDRIAAKAVSRDSLRSITKNSRPAAIATRRSIILSRTKGFSGSSNTHAVMSG